MKKISKIVIKILTSSPLYIAVFSLAIVFAVISLAWDKSKNIARVLRNWLFV